MREQRGGQHDPPHQQPTKVSHAANLEGYVHVISMFTILMKCLEVISVLKIK